MDNRKVRLTLVGLDGNAFYLLGAFRAAAKQQKFTVEFIERILKDATSGDYNHLLQVLSSVCEDDEEECAEQWHDDCDIEDEDML